MMNQLTVEINLYLLLCFREPHSHLEIILVFINITMTSLYKNMNICTLFRNKTKLLTIYYYKSYDLAKVV